MSTRITLPADLEESVRSAAREQGVTPEDYVIQALRDNLDSGKPGSSGANSRQRTLDLESGDNPSARREAAQRTEATGEDF